MPGHGAAQPEMHKPPAQNIDRITNVSVPTLTIYKAPGAQGPVPAIIICPGGGYGILAWDLEGTEVAAWLNNLHITAIVLKYRVPGNRDGAFQDLERACRLVHAHAAEWNIQPGKLGVMGFSAGGHLTARLSNHYDKPAYPNIDDVDKQSCRPDFVMLIYPAYLATKDNKTIAPEMTVSANTPQTLIVHTKDDKNYEPGSVIYDAALTADRVPHKFLIYDNGGPAGGCAQNVLLKSGQSMPLHGYTRSELFS